VGLDSNSNVFPVTVSFLFFFEAAKVLVPELKERKYNPIIHTQKKMNLVFGGNWFEVAVGARFQ